MSIAALNFAFSCDLPPLTKLVFLALADYVDHDGQWKVKHSTLEKKTGLSRRSIIRHVDALVQLGLLETEETRRKDGKRGANVYKVTERHLEPPQSDTQSLCKGDRESQHLPPVTLPPVVRADTDAQFDQFWSVYPRHIAKKDARRAFEKALKEDTYENIIRGATDYSRWCEAEAQPERFIKHATTWLRGAGWRDERKVGENGASRSRRDADSLAAKARRAVNSLNQIQPDEGRGSGPSDFEEGEFGEGGGASGPVIDASATEDDCRWAYADAPDYGLEDVRH